MPTYQYACRACGHRFEAVQSFTDNTLTECPECSGSLRKLFGSVGVVFKGSGFYRTDSRAKEHSGESESGNQNGSSDSSKGKSENTSGGQKGPAESGSGSGGQGSQTTGSSSSGSGSSGDSASSSASSATTS